MRKNPILVSFFLHRWKKACTNLSLAEFVSDIRGPRWEIVTRAHRRWLERGMKKEAAQAKDNQPGVTIAGRFHGGHAAHQIKELSGLLMLDFDHTNERTAEIIARLRELPSVMVAFVSISGQGIKAVIRVDAENATQYATAYAIVAAEVSRWVDAPCDLACRDLGRLCYAVHDPEVYYNPSAEVFPWREQVIPLGEEEAASADASAIPPLPGSSAQGFIPSFLADFLERNPFVSGTRHDCMLKLGRVARYKEFSQIELQQLIAVSCEKCAQPDFLPTEIEKTLLSGYQYASSVGTPPNSGDRVQKVQGSPLTPQNERKPDCE